MLQQTGKALAEKLFIAVVVFAAALLCAVLRQDANAYAADNAAQKIQPLVISTQESIKKTGSCENSLDVFMVPVLAIGSGKLKATVALSEPQDGEILSIFCLGACYGPYSVVDYKIGSSHYSLSTTVTVETYGVFLVFATVTGPAENFPKQCSIMLAF